MLKLFYLLTLTLNYKKFVIILAIAHIYKYQMTNFIDLLFSIFTAFSNIILIINQLANGFILHYFEFHLCWMPHNSDYNNISLYGTTKLLLFLSLHFCWHLAIKCQLYFWSFKFLNRFTEQMHQNPIYNGYRFLYAWNGPNI